METDKYCVICQDFEVRVGHGSMQCPNVVCLKCGKKGHAKIHCLFGMENFPFPDEILLEILGYLDLIDLKKCARVSKRFHKICMDKSLIFYRSYDRLSNIRAINGKLILVVKCKVIFFFCSFNYTIFCVNLFFYF